MGRGVIACSCAAPNKNARISPRVSKLIVDLALRFDRQLDVDRFFFLAQCATQLRERDILQLTNALARHAELLADFLERLRLSAVEPEALENDLLLAVVEDIEQSADFVAQIFIAQQLERR